MSDPTKHAQYMNANNLRKSSNVNRESLPISVGIEPLRSFQPCIANAANQRLEHANPRCMPSPRMQTCYLCLVMPILKQTQCPSEWFHSACCPLELQMKNTHKIRHINGLRLVNASNLRRLRIVNSERFPSSDGIAPVTSLLSFTIL